MVRKFWIGVGPRVDRAWQYSVGTPSMKFLLLGLEDRKQALVRNLSLPHDFADKKLRTSIGFYA